MELIRHCHGVTEISLRNAEKNAMVIANESLEYVEQANQLVTS